MHSLEHTNYSRVTTRLGPPRGRCPSAPVSDASTALCPRPNELCCYFKSSALRPAYPSRARLYASTSTT